MINDHAKRLREAREALGLSQKALARRARISERTVRRAEHGQIVAPKTVLTILARLRGADARHGEEAMEAEGEVTALVVREPMKTPTFEDLMAAADDFLDGDLPPGVGPDGVPRFVKQEEHLPSGYEIVSFIESYPETGVYVKQDPEPGQVREEIQNFISSVLSVKKALRHGGFNSAERFAAQCAFADILDTLHRAGWFVWNSTTRKGKEDEAGNYGVTWAGHLEIDCTPPHEPISDASRT